MHNLVKTNCNDCGLPQFTWQYHWRIKGKERLKVCKTCRNKVNTKDKLMTKSIDNQMEEINKLANLSPEETVFPFGHYKGQSVEDIPNFYLEWFLESDFAETRYDWLTPIVEKELNYRNENNINIHADT